MEDKFVIKGKEVANQLKGAIDSGASIRCVSHYDCDGICAGVIAKRGLEREQAQPQLEFVKDLTEETVDRLSQVSEDVLLLTDIGSGQIDKLNELEGKQVIIADHHEPETSDNGSHITQLNPHQQGIDGGEKISGAGTTYLLMRLLNKANQDLIIYALIGAVGDIQKKDEDFLGLNENLLEDAERWGYIKRKKGLKIFGRRGRTLPKALAYTTDPYLPGLSNNESGAVQFLSELGIGLRDGDRLRTLSDLSQEEEKTIVEGLLRRDIPEVEQLLGNIYLLENGWEIGEFASVLNACGRLEEFDKALKICLEEDMETAAAMQKRYSRKLGSYLRKIRDNPEMIKDHGTGELIKGKDKINANLIGTIASIRLKSDGSDKQIILSYAYRDDGRIKLSGRITEDLSEQGYEMNQIMDDLTSRCQGEGGGHKLAAGGRIPRKEENRFLKVAAELLQSITEAGDDLQK